MEKFRQILNRLLIGLCSLIFVLMIIVGTYQIVTRYVFNSPSTVSEELLTYSFTWMALLSAALVFGKKDHMRMTFLSDKLEGNAALILSVISELFVLGFAALILIYGGIAITRLTMTQITASLGISMGYVYMVLPISGILIVIYSILNICEITGEKQGGGER